MDVVFFLLQKRDENYREFILQKIVIFVDVISLNLSLEWPFLFSIMKTNNGFFGWKKMEITNDDHKW